MRPAMLYTLLVFAHVLATSMALGAIVATDLRMLSKLTQDKVRIRPPNHFVARLVTLALVLLYATGGAIVWLSSQQNPAVLANPKLQGKLVLVVLLTFNAVVLHRWTFPRLARGRRVARWKPADWLIVVVPVATSNALWMFCAFLGIARPWNHTVSIGYVFGVAAGVFAFALIGVTTILCTAARHSTDPASRVGRAVDTLRASLAAVGRLGQRVAAASRLHSRLQSVLPSPSPARLPAARSAQRGDARRSRVHSRWHAELHAELQPEPPPSAAARRASKAKHRAGVTQAGLPSWARR